MFNERSLLAMYGGTFDPVHYGHLNPVEMLADLIGLKQVMVIPNKVPPHRPQPEATSEQRKHMLELAIADKRLFVLDERELQRDTPSYTSKTLKDWRAENSPDQPLAFIIGQDSLLNFLSWHQYKTILNNAHLIVCRRPGYPMITIAEEYQKELNRHFTNSADELHSLHAGKIYLAKTPWLNVSATLIRQRLQKNLPCDGFLPVQVLEYIHQEGLYHRSIKY